MNKRTRSKGLEGVAVAYLRASGDEPLDLGAQRAAIEAWATARGATIASWCTEDGASGGAVLETRPELVRALSLLREHRAGVLIVAMRDCVASDDIILAAMAEKLAADAGAIVLSADDEERAPDDPSTQLRRRMVDAFAEYERAAMSMRARKTQAAKRARSEPIGGIPPWGYRVSEDRSAWIPDEREQRMLSLVRELRSKGLTFEAIASELHAAGYASRTGGKFKRDAIYKMTCQMENVAA